LLENLQDSDVSDAAGEASAQRNADSRKTVRNNGRNGFAGELAPKGLHRANDLPQTSHGEPHIFWPVEAQTPSGK
jgi:hypothetical protein